MADPASVAASAHWVHDLSPFIIRFGDNWGIRWYGMAYLAGLVWGYWMLVRWAKMNRSPVAPHEIQDFVLYGGLGMIIGGRLGYCVGYGLHEWLAHPLYVFMLWKGGMASHGGMIGLFAGTWLYARKTGKSLGVLIDLASVTGPMGVALGRIANFINGELWGRVSDVPWAVIFPGEIDPPPGIPEERVHAWQQAHWYLAQPRHPSQLYAACVEGLFVLAILMPLHARHRRPWLTTGCFCVLYSIGRFVDEFFREPDAGQPGSPGVPAILGFMSKGQAYTIPFFIVGVAITVWALRRPPRPDLYLPPSSSATDGSAPQTFAGRA